MNLHRDICRYTARLWRHEGGGVALIFAGARVWGAAGVARFLGTRPGWMAAQRWILGGALALIAVKLATDSRA